MLLILPTILFRLAIATVFLEVSGEDTCSSVVQDGNLPNFFFFFEKLLLLELLCSSEATLARAIRGKVGLYEMRSQIQWHSGPSVAPWGLLTIGTKEWRAPALDEPKCCFCPCVVPSNWTWEVRNYGG